MVSEFQFYNFLNRVMFENENSYRKVLAYTNAVHAFSGSVVRIQLMSHIGDSDGYWENASGASVSGRISNLRFMFRALSVFSSKVVA